MSENSKIISEQSFLEIEKRKKLSILKLFPYGRAYINSKGRLSYRSIQIFAKYPDGLSINVPVSRTDFCPIVIDSESTHY
jgi:hypothetical protein